MHARRLFAQALPALAGEWSVAFHVVFCSSGCFEEGCRRGWWRQGYRMDEGEYNVVSRLMSFAQLPQPGDVCTLHSYPGRVGCRSTRIRIYVYSYISLEYLFIFVCLQYNHFPSAHARNPCSTITIGLPAPNVPLHKLHRNSVIIFDSQCNYETAEMP